MEDQHLDLQACTSVHQTLMRSLRKVCPGVRPTATHLLLRCTDLALCLEAQGMHIAYLWLW